MDNTDIQKENPFIEVDIEFEEGETLLPVTDNTLPGVRPHYFVSSHGRMFTNSSGILKEMKQTNEVTGANENGSYKSVSLSYVDDNGKIDSKRTKVHRIVASEFKPLLKTKENNVVDHVDCNKENNHVDNLEWVSLFENNRRAYDNGLYKLKLSDAEATLNAVANELEIGEKTIREIAEEYQLTTNQVMRIKKGSYRNIVGKREFKFHKDLTDDDLVDIFKRSRAGEEFDKLAEEYDVSYSTIRNIYYPNGGIYEERLANKGIVVPKLPKANDDIALDIYIRANNGESVDDLAKEYSLSRESVIKMKNGSGYYKEFLARKGVKVEPYTVQSDEELLEIYNLAKHGMSDKEIAEKYGMHKQSVVSLRTGCKRYNEFLKKYNLEPILKERPMPYKKENRFSEDEAIEIYNRIKSERLTTRQLGAEYGCDKSVIADIRFCRRSYEYLHDKYGLEPLNDL